MTAHPNTFDFAAPDRNATAIVMRPTLVERYWGYEISKTEWELDIAVLTRTVGSIVMIGTFLAAFAIWVVPGVALTGPALATNLLTSVVLLAVTAALFRYVGRGTRVRVQIDTAMGELREVVAGPFGSSVTLTNYGLDCVEAVRVMASKTDPDSGQLQINLKGGTIVPAGNGALIALRHLRDRVAADCGTERAVVMRDAVWLGPLPR